MIYLDVKPNPERKREEGEQCGYFFGICEKGLYCDESTDLPDYPGICKRSK